VNLGTTERLLGNYPQAIAAFTRALELNPNDALTLTNLGSAQFRGGDAPASIQTLHKAIAADSGSYVALTFGYDTANSYFIKVQDNDGDGFFDRYGFDTGNNDLNGPFNALGFGFQSASIDVSLWCVRWLAHRVRRNLTVSRCSR